jgi:ABC-type multidrug transport system fused ATPase/permease subunit
MFTAVLVNLVKDALLVVGTVAILFALNVRLALIALAVVPAFMAASFVFRRKARGAYREVRRLLAQLNATLAEDLSGIKIVQVFRREQRRKDGYRVTNEQFYAANIHQLVIFGVFRPLIELIATVGIALVLVFGGIASLQGGLTLGALVAFLSYVRQMFEPLSDMSEKYNIMQSAMASSERIFGIMDQEPTILERPAPVQTAVRGRVSFQGVSFAYVRDRPVLRDVTFTVEPGKSIAIVGPTGAGKTSIINLVCRFYDPDSGSVTLDGVDLRDISLRTLRDSIAVVLQDAFIFSRSIEDNIRLGTPMPRDQVEGAADMVQAKGFIERLAGGFDETMSERGATLSTGQKQLLCFARALAHDPKILILDEATSSVDPATERLIQQAIDTLMRGRTSIIVAHRISTIQRADEILVIDDGRIVERGTHSELLARRGIYYNLYVLQYVHSGTQTAEEAG